MKYDDEQLAQLLGALPEAPEHLVRIVNEIPRHLPPSEPAEAVDDDGGVDPDASLDVASDAEIVDYELDQASGEPGDELEWENPSS